MTVDYELCHTQDDYAVEHTQWVVTLENNEVIFQDDDRPGLTERSAWVRLKRYCGEQGHYITKMYLKFRSHIEFPLPDDAIAYYFSHQALGIAGSDTAGTLGFYIVGYADLGMQYNSIRVECWKVPELTKSHFLEGHFEEYRVLDLDDPRVIGKGLL